MWREMSSHISMLTFLMLRFFREWLIRYRYDSMLASLLLSSSPMISTRISLLYSSMTAA